MIKFNSKLKTILILKSVSDIMIKVHSKLKIILKFSIKKKKKSFVNFVNIKLNFKDKYSVKSVNAQELFHCIRV